MNPWITNFLPLVISTHKSRVGAREAICLSQNTWVSKGEIATDWINWKVTHISEIWKKAWTRINPQSNSMNDPGGFLFVHKIFDNFTFCNCQKSQICLKTCHVYRKTVHQSWTDHMCVVKRHILIQLKRTFYFERAEKFRSKDKRLSHLISRSIKHIAKPLLDVMETPKDYQCSKSYKDLSEIVHFLIPKPEMLLFEVTQFFLKKLIFFIQPKV